MYNSSSRTVFSATTSLYFVNLDYFLHYSNSVYVFVDRLPTITIEPVSDSICVGNSTSFFINAFGSAISYRWQVNNGAGYTNVPNALPYTGFNNDTLTVTNPSIALTNNKYRCIVTGVCAKVQGTGSWKLLGTGGSEVVSKFQFNPSVKAVNNESVSPVVMEQLY